MIDSIIRVEPDESISFGDYLSKEKKKVNEFELKGDLYKVKTHDQITRLEKNANLLFESVPGSCIYNFAVTDKHISFMAEGRGDTKITLELEPECEYKIIIDDVNVGSTKSNLSGKIIFSVGLTDTPQSVKVDKVM